MVAREPRHVIPAAALIVAVLAAAAIMVSPLMPWKVKRRKKKI